MPAEMSIENHPFLLGLRPMGCREPERKIEDGGGEERAEGSDRQRPDPSSRGGSGGGFTANPEFLLAMAGTMTARPCPMHSPKAFRSGNGDLRWKFDGRWARNCSPRAATHQTGIPSTFSVGSAGWTVLLPEMRDTLT